MNTPIKHIAILGSTGSIGTQALDVIRNHKDKFCVEVLVAGNNAELLISQAKEFEPNIAIIANQEKYDLVSRELSGTDTKVFAGEESIYDVVQFSEIDVVLAAMVGFSGLIPVIKAIEAGKTIALANKETLVVAGELITKKIKKHRAPVIPVDSEHSAVFQCLMGEPANRIKKLILTASGGPFRGKDMEFLKRVSPEDALKHPTWNMGKKVSIDSASMMNKGLEVIEAHWLFSLPPEKIEVVVHPSSIVHSMVEFIDGSMKAQLGNNDMRIPIQYAFSWPDRIPTHVNPIDLTEIGSMHFEKPDILNFPNLKLAYEALKKGGDAPCILNAANEIAVDAFLKRQIGFNQIAEINKDCLSALPVQYPVYMNDFVDSDKRARIHAEHILKKIKL
ncbi:MAG: 1-deoxy-D-xylulose-5-phosphate reductoisomerase [Candidatus Delongbacteria bacterium]|jgi:1-deoxy-D-xylulose-5-phosphate reductoisomerase|nr:1-deoxy-D-xylulose-5-phosphate reductoisomerase [Candidatus Delongbacteria bacterium]